MTQTAAKPTLRRSALAVEAPAPGPNDSLWPIPCPTICVTGAHESGKTTFGLTVNPNTETTCIIDMELSAVSQISQMPGFVEGVNYFNPYKILQQKYPGGFSQDALWVWWLENYRKIFVPKKFKVGHLDVATDLESALFEHIHRNPEKYRTSREQLDKVFGKAFQIMRSIWKPILSDLATRLETLVYVVHMKDEYIGSNKTGKKIPQGQSTLRELATLEIELKRTKDAALAPPAGKLLKDRLQKIAKKPDGNWKPIPVLPPLINPCTPGTIRWYMLNPVGLRELQPGEILPADEDQLTEDQRMTMKLAISENYRAVEEARLKTAEVQSQTTVARRTATAEKNAEKEKADLQGRMVILFKNLMQDKSLTPKAVMESIVKRGGIQSRNLRQSIDSLSLESLKELVESLGKKFPNCPPW